MCAEANVQQQYIPCSGSELVGFSAPEQSEHSSGEPRLRDMSRSLRNFPRIVLLGMIRGYQFLVSPMLPPNTCRFYPTCSHYGYQSIYKYGALKGSLMAAWRVLRCNPFNPGGFDPVP